MNPFLLQSPDLYTQDHTSTVYTSCTSEDPRRSFQKHAKTIKNTYAVVLAFSGSPVDPSKASSVTGTQRRRFGKFREAVHHGRPEVASEFQGPFAAKTLRVRLRA